MPPRFPRIHCELGPVLVNRTAVYRLCRALPGELARRGFRVSSSALLARLPPDGVEPVGPLQRRLYGLSLRWLNGAVNRPRLFRVLRPVAGAVLSRLRVRGFPLFLDPLYLLFHGRPDRGLVFVYDVTPATDPGWHGAGVGRLYRLAFDELARSRCHVIATSRNTADHLRVNWGVAPSRLSVLSLGLFPRPEPAPPAAAPAAPFLLFVGSVEPRKNVAGLIRAFTASGLFVRRGVRLRVVGAVPGVDDPTAALARRTPGVDLVGFADDADLAAAYRDCLAFVYPSFCEGFGLPLLEAMHHGLACLAPTTGASPEVGGDAALYVNPYSSDDVVEGLCRVAELSKDERRRLEERARERAASFTWQRFYDGLAEVLARMA